MVTTNSTWCVHSWNSLVSGGANRKEQATQVAGNMGVQWIPATGMVFGIVFHEECLTLVPFIEGRTETVKYGYLEKKIALLESLLRALFMSLFLRL